MRKSYVSLLARCPALLLFLASASASANSFISAELVPQPPAVYIAQWNSFCWDLPGQHTCVIPWLEANLPEVGVPGAVTFDTQNVIAGAHLVNAQQGSFSVFLTPSFDANELPSRDEFQVSLANNQGILAVSQDGKLEFTVDPGTDYFLLLDGTVRGGTTYSLSISPVPEPASGAFFVVGAALVAYRVRQRRRNPVNA